ncbi:MAG TPA: fibronectin type III domain-containing protein, partial [Humisphaera sp.]|nr:fibronectin type III domain-containing protein [Humisphaera sp.]
MILRSIVNQIVGLHRTWRGISARPPLFDLQPLEQRVFLSAYPHIAPDSSNSDSTVHHGNAFVVDLNANTDDYPGWGQWSINWGDGNSDSPNGWTSAISHTYDTGPNDYTITASYTDGSQNYYGADANVNVHVFGDPPSPITASPNISSDVSTIDEGSNFNLTLTPNTNDDPWADHWLVNWGDASAVQTVTGTAPAVSHTFASSPTNYSISAAYITGDSVPHTAAPFSLQVNDVPPMITLSDNFYHYKTATDGYGEGQATEGSLFQLNLSAYDPGGQTINSWDIDWGDLKSDGSADIQTLSGNPSSVSHVYGRGSTTYNITATAHQGSSTYSVSWSAMASDVGPSLLVTRPASVVEGTLYTLNLAAAEPTGSITQLQHWTINWGDSTSSTVAATATTASHTYSGSPSSYTLSITATDQDGTYTAQLNNDSTFGNGRVQTDIGTHTYDQGYNSIVQPDGKVLTLASSNGSLVVLRYKADGSLDTNDGFGSDASHSSGIITTPYSLYSYDYSNAMALQPDGKILVVGQIGNPSLFYGYQNCFIARFDADGSHDDSFGTNGQVAADYINGVALQSDGKIIARGLNSSWQTVLSRYNTDGTIDHDFAPDVADANGVEPVNGGANWQLWPTMTDTMLIEPDDSIILAGGRFSLSMAHYSADGILDPSFGSSGYVNIGYNAAASVTAIAMQGDRILLAGTVNAYSYYGYVGNFWIGRFNLDGSTDHSFASPYGTVTTDFGSFSTPTDDQVRGLGILSDGTILLGGSSNNLINGATLAFVRYNADGSLDSDFGTGGKLVTGSAQSINRVITLPDDRIMAVGTANGNVTNQDVLLGSFLKDNKVYVTPDVVNLTATAASATQINLTWTLNLSTASAIEVDRSTDGTNFTALTTTLSGSATSYSDTGLSEGHYYYRVRLMSGGVPLSQFSAVADAYAIHAPQSPAAASTTDSGTTISWTSDSSIATDANVYISDDGITFSYLDTVTAAQLSYVVSGLDAQTQYWFEVTNAVGTSESPASSAVTVTTLAVVAPTGLSGTFNSATDITLHWANHAADASGYEVDWSTDGTNFQMLDETDAATTSYDVQNLVPGTAYTFQVQAVNDAGVSDVSTWSTTSGPPTPVGLSATVAGSTLAMITWDPAIAASGYELKRIAADSTTQIISVSGGSSATYFDFVPDNTTTYSYQIRADGSGNSDWSDAVNVAFVPAAPSGLNDAISGTSVALTWTDNSNNESGFQLESSSDGQSYGYLGSVAANATSFNVDLSSVGPTTTFRITAQNSAGNSDYDYAQNPAAPSGLAAIPLSTSSVFLAWDNNASNQSGFRVQYQNGDDWFTLANTGAATTQFQDSGLSASQTRNYRVIAYNSAGDSSPVGVATTPPDGTQSSFNDTAPGTPTAVNAGTGVNLQWTQPTSGAPSGYMVEEKRPSADGTPSNWGVVTTTSSLSQFVGLPMQASAYQFRIVAYTRRLNGVVSVSPPSDFVSASYMPVPGTPTNLQQLPALSGYQTTLTWDMGGLDVDG